MSSNSYKLGIDLNVSTAWCWTVKNLTIVAQKNSADSISALDKRNTQ